MRPAAYSRQPLTRLISGRQQACDLPRCRASAHATQRRIRCALQCMGACARRDPATQLARLDRPTAIRSPVLGQFGRCGRACDGGFDAVADDGRVGWCGRKIARRRTRIGLGTELPGKRACRVEVDARPASRGRLGGGWLRECVRRSLRRGDRRGAAKGRHRRVLARRRCGHGRRRGGARGSGLGAFGRRSGGDEAYRHRRPPVPGRGGRARAGDRHPGQQ